MQCHFGPRLCRRCNIAWLATNDMRYTESETDKRRNRKMSCHSTKQSCTAKNVIVSVYACQQNSISS